MGPGGDVSTSEGKGDFGAAQVEFPEVCMNTGNRWEREPLEPNGLEAAHAVQTICEFLDLLRNFASSRMKMAWETNVTLETSLSFGRMKGKVSLILEKPES